MFNVPDRVHDRQCIFSMGSRIRATPASIST
jgi:hypothetical protein